ncbi:YbjN domain-containing protein [Cellulomonas sp. ATA003]|uniref:YbjN domain-containing protein n=1 Tax=Cellulomonas sp. ATA003 TaxID=3073064 RepID=UPI002873DD21|nr:YbjN domain-containing protein [Cellulomonas sp. ATA003]WNB84876.1 YbjN domain-containing protein [Cellulomonas sp. ATA003]
MGFHWGGRRGWWAGRDPDRRDDTGADLSDGELQARVEDLLARELGAQPLPADGSSDPLPAQDDDGIPWPLTVGRIVEWFEDNGFSYFIDNDGDLGGLWRGRLFYFFLFGDRSEILQVRGQWNREVSIERLPEVLEMCNEWNADRIWPKAYVRVRDNGMVHVVAEVATDLEHGVTDAQLGQLLHCGLSTGSMLFDGMDEMYPDPAAAAP